MARKSKKAVEVKEEVKEEMVGLGVMPPLPTEEVKEEEKVEVIQVKEIKEAPAKEEVKETPVKVEAPKAPEKYYAFCRISGGLILDIVDEMGDKKKKILKSGNKSDVAADGTRTFQLRPSEFGITELTAEEAKQIKAALEPTKAWKKGFVFIVENEAEGMRMAQEQAVKYPKQGTEQLGSEQAKEVSKYSE